MPRSVKPPLARGSGGRCGHRPPFPGIIPFVPVRPLVMPRRTEFALRNSALRQNYSAYRAAPSQMGPLRRGFSGAFPLLNHLVQTFQCIRQPADAVNQPQLHRLLSHTRLKALCGDPFFYMLGRTEFALRNSALRQNYGAYRAAPIADGAPTARIRRSFSAPQSSGADFPAHPPARRCGQSDPAPPPPRRKSHCPRRRPAPPSGASAL